MDNPILASSPRFWSSVRGYQLHKRVITYMSLNQDSICNYACQGCFRYPERRNGLSNLLRISDYIHLLREFKKSGGLAIEISGEGEPLHPQNQFRTLSIIRYASKLGLWTTLITNGSLLTQKILKELRDLQVALIVSLHSLEKQSYEKDSCRRDSFETAMNNIDMAGQIFRGTSWKENGYDVKRLCVHWTLQNDNLPELSNARKFCDDKRLHFSIAPLANVGHALSHPEIQLPPEFYNLQEINSIGDESIIFYDEPNGRIVCGTCKYGLNVGADGNILLDAHGGYEVEIANIRDISFKEAVELQHRFSRKMFDKLDHFCPVRDPGWNNFLKNKEYF
ncbi:MAG: radical SAM protein [Candidatus Moraniibacteriota bacterium]